MKKPSDKDYLTPQEVAEMLMVSPVTVRQWAQKGGLKALTTPGGHRRFQRSDVLNFAANRGIKSGLHKKRKLLIVDDDVLLAGYLHEVFSNAQEDFEVKVVHDGFSAGSLIQAFLPDVILLDIMMPGINGIQVCGFLKQNADTANTHVIAMTGLDEPDIRQKMLDAGAEMCLHKPLQVDELIAAVDSFYPTEPALPQG